MSIRQFAVLLLLSVCASVAGAQPDSDSLAFNADAERDFVAAMKEVQAGSWDMASVLFLEHLRRYPRSHRSTGAMIIGAKALTQLKKHREAIKLLKDLLDLYPGSLYSDDARYTLGLNYYRLRRYDDAAAVFAQVREGARDSLLLRRSEQMIDLLASGRMTALQTEQLRESVADSSIFALLTLRLAEQTQRTGDTRRAIDFLKQLRGFSPRKQYVAEALGFLGRLEQGRALKIGVLLPLMLRSERPGARDVGVEFLEGMKIALDEFSKRSLTKVIFEVKDTERDPSIAAQVVADLTSDDDVVAILGPISSQEAFASAGIANAKGIPILTPTGTSNGIAAIGPHVFQANPDYDTRGRVMARYAWERLGVQSFGVLAPTDAVGKMMADSFIDEVRTLGGEMVSVQWYSSGSTDVRSQLEEMRLIALKKKEVPFVHFGRSLKNADILAILMAGAQQSVVDSLMEVGGTMSVDSLFGPNGRAIADSLKLPTQLPVIKYDSLGIVVDSIGALFVPIASSDEIAVVSSQVRLYNFRTHLLGTGDWYEPAELDRNRQYADGVEFSVDSSPDPNDPKYKTFAAAFQKNVKRAPGVNALFGYDAAAALLHVLSKGATLRNEITEGLNQLKGFRGLHSTISFLPGRVNGYLSVLRYKQGKISKVAEVDLTQAVEPVQQQ